MWSWSVRMRWPIRSRPADRDGRRGQSALLYFNSVAVSVARPAGPVSPDGAHAAGRSGGSIGGKARRVGLWGAFRHGAVCGRYHESVSCFSPMFPPRPEVASAVVLLRMNERARLSQQEEIAFRALVKAAFAHRRKTLVNSLRDEGYEPHSVTEILRRLDIASTRRAETLSVEDFLRLALALG